MIPSYEQAKEIQNSQSTYHAVKKLLETKNPEVLYNVKSDDQQTIEDIALIQCFFGTKIARIRATTTAIEFNLRMTRRPSTWVFVECQKSEWDCAFSWVQNYGIRYKFVKMPEGSEGIMLKNSLWNIGATLCSESRLCFIDSDVVMCDSDWAESTAKRFEEGYDVLSLASFQYYQFDMKCQLMETIGHKWTYKKEMSAHAGFTLGMTRKAFEEIGGFDPALILADIHAYYKMFGRILKKWYGKWLVQKVLDSEGANGHSFRFSYVSNIACHVWHGDEKTKYIKTTNLLKTAGIEDIGDVVEYDNRDFNVLPKWKDGPRCRILRKILVDFNAGRIEGDNLCSEYVRRMGEELGVPDESHPLVVCTTIKKGFDVGVEDFTKFMEMAESRLAEFNPIVLFFTDVEVGENDFNVVGLEGYDANDEAAQCLRGDLKWPEGAVVYYVPFRLKNYDRPWIPDEVLRRADGTVLMSANGKYSKQG